ncbi:hypothetical protein OIU78_004133 [Salix suchowensis]|nr:hypothetical protein OIU78_004133 [Salix suchowensis]
MEKCVLDSYEIPAKISGFNQRLWNSRDPKLRNNPLKYNPERFMDNDTDFKDQDYRFLPFGGGRRGCPGSAFAVATIEIELLARLLYHFDWSFPLGVGPDDHI